MKCPACNHTQEEYNFDTGITEGNNAEPFEEIEGHFTMKKEYIGITQVYLFACPKCNNVMLGD